MSLENSAAAAMWHTMIKMVAAGLTVVEPHRVRLL